MTNEGTVDLIELVDLGDAMVETKQCSPMFFLPDSWFGWGSYEGQVPPPQCPPY